MPDASDIEQGSFIIYNREPYKVKRKETITAGTHMHSKLKFYLQALFSGVEKQAVFAHKDSVEAADIQMETGQVIVLNGPKGQVMDTRSFETVDVEINEELASQLKENDVITYVVYQGKGIVLGKR